PGDGCSSLRPGYRGLVGRLNFAFHDPFVIGHFHTIHLKIDHVDGFVGGAINGGLGPVHAGHVIGIQHGLATGGKRRFARVLEFFVNHPFMVGDRVTAIGGGIAHRIGGGIKRPRDGGFSSVHAGHVIRIQDDGFSDCVSGIRGFLDPFGGRTTIWVVIMCLGLGFVCISCCVALGGGWFWGCVVVTCSSTAGQREGPDCCTKGESGHEGQFVHRYSCIDSACLEGSGTTLAFVPRGRLTRCCLIF